MDHFIKENLLITRPKTKVDIIKIRNLHMTVVFIKTHSTDKVKKKVKVIHLKANMSMVEKLKEFLSGIKEPKNMNMKDLLIKTLDSKMRVF